jgi:hypothetical protein
MNFSEEFNKCNKKVICNIVLDNIGKLFRRFSGTKKQLFSTVILFMILLILESTLLVVFKQPFKPAIVAILFAAFISSLSFFVVSWCYHYTNTQIEVAIRDSIISDEIENRLIIWLQKYTRILPQLLTSITLGIIVVFVTLYIEKNYGLPFDSNKISFIILGLVAFFLGQGGYWAYVTPLIIFVVKRCKLSDIGVNPLFTRGTPILNAISRILNKFAIWDFVMVTLCLINVSALHIDFDKISFWYLIILLFLGYLLTIWTFIIPQINISKIIKTSKKLSMQLIVEDSKILFNSLNKGNIADFEKLKHYIQLHEIIQRQPSWLINLPGSVLYIISQIIVTFYTAVIAVGYSNVSTNIKTLIQKVFSCV